MNAPTGRIDAFPFSDLSQMVWKPTSWLIKGLVPDNSLYVVYGGQDSGKTYYVLGQAMSIATGLDFHGHQVKRRGPVFYIAGEFAQGYVARKEAWQKGNDHLVEQIYLSDQSCDLADSKSMDDVRSTLNAYRKRIGDPALVVIDTLNRNYTGNEDKTEDMSKVLHVLDGIRLDFRCTVVLVHHTGTAREERPRGNQAVYNSSNVACYVQRKPNASTFCVSTVKMKDNRTPPPAVFRMNPVAIGIDEDGVPEESSFLTREESETTTPLKTYSKTTYSILTWFRNNPGEEAGPKHLADVLKLGADNVGKSLKELVQEKLVEQAARGLYRLIRKVPNAPENSERSEA